MKTNKNKSILVLAGHLDDAILAVGGILRQFIKAGSRVHVFCFGNGDEGFTELSAQASAADKFKAEAAKAHKILGEDVQVTSAFQNIAYEHLLNQEQIECDVLVTGTSKEARFETLKLVTAAGLNGWDAGPLENSVVIEGLTSVLININKQYGSTNAGIKIIGVSKG